MSIGKMIVLVALLAVAFGAESLKVTSDGRGLLHLTAFGAILGLLIFSYLWWKILGVVVRLVLLALAAAALLVLVRQAAAMVP